MKLLHGKQKREICYLKPPCTGDCNDCKFYAPLSEVVGNAKTNVRKVRKGKQGRKASNY